MILQGEKDWQKYETARRLKKCVERIRAQYREDWRSKEMRIRQRAVALYFIDKVSLHHSGWFRSAATSTAFANMTLEHKSSLKSLGYIYSNSQKYIVWVKIIKNFFRILRSCSVKIFSVFPTVNISKLNF